MPQYWGEIAQYQQSWNNVAPKLEQPCNTGVIILLHSTIWLHRGHIVMHIYCINSYNDVAPVWGHIVMHMLYNFL